MNKNWVENEEWWGTAWTIRQNLMQGRITQHSGSSLFHWKVGYSGDVVRSGASPSIGFAIRNVEKVLEEDANVQAA